MRNERNSFSVLFFLVKTRLKKNGEAPIRMRITVRGQPADFTIKRSVPVQYWNQAKEKCTINSKLGNEINHYLESVRARVMQIHRELEMEGRDITIDLVRDKYYGRDMESKTLIQIYEEHNRKCEALIGKDFAKSTVEKFNTSLLCLKEYIKYQYNKEDIALSELNNMFISDFEFYLKTQRNLQHNSSIKHLKNLKKILRIALSNDWIKKDPFVGIQFKHEHTSPEFLSMEELQTMIDKDISIPRLEIVRDVFVFCCYTGLAFIDVKLLTPEHLVKDNKGNIWIRKNREKTKNMCNIPVLNSAKHIIEKYSNNPQCLKNNVLLPVLSNQKMNSYLKELADICGIQKKLTTHVARHTFATLALSYGMSIESVSKMLGHNQIRTTQIYAKVTEEKIARGMTLFKNRSIKS